MGHGPNAVLTAAIIKGEIVNTIYEKAKDFEIFINTFSRFPPDFKTRRKNCARSIA